MQKMLVIFAALTLAACSDDRLWKNSDPSHSTQHWWDKDRYECAQENTHSTTRYAYGVLRSGPEVNEGMFEQCVRARGWYVAGHKG